MQMISQWISSLSQSPQGEEIQKTLTTVKIDSPLTKAIQAVPISKTQEIALQKPISTQASKEKYFSKKHFEILWLIKEGFNHQNPYQIINHIFNGWHFQPLDLSKPQLFYENILIETSSAIFKHYPAKENPNSITHSTCQILRVLSPTQWGIPPNEPRKFPAKFTTRLNHSGLFNYWDYQQAWYKTFFLQNKNNRHSGIKAKGEVICELQKVSNKFRISNYRFQNWFYFELFSVFC